MERIAEGVWLLQGDLRKSMNIYFLDDGDGVVQFDAGSSGMVKVARQAAERLGGLKRVVLGHAHADHRGTAPSMGVPVHCHPTKSPTPKATPRSPPTSTSSSCRLHRFAGSTPSCCGAGTAAR